MKILLIILLTTALASCSKGKVCYDCIVVSGANTYEEKVCTKGNPHDQLPDQDANGMLVWQCTQR